MPLQCHAMLCGLSLAIHWLEGGRARGPCLVTQPRPALHKTIHRWRQSDNRDWAETRQHFSGRSRSNSGRLNFWRFIINREAGDKKNMHLERGPLGELHLTRNVLIPLACVPNMAVMTQGATLGWIAGGEEGGTREQLMQWLSIRASLSPAK